MFFLKKKHVTFVQRRKFFREPYFPVLGTQDASFGFHKSQLVAHPEGWRNFFSDTFRVFFEEMLSLGNSWKDMRLGQLGDYILPTTY